MFWWKLSRFRKINYSLGFKLLRTYCFSSVRTYLCVRREREKRERVCVREIQCVHVDVCTCECVRVCVFAVTKGRLIISKVLRPLFLRNEVGHPGDNKTHQNFGYSRRKTLKFISSIYELIKPSFLSSIFYSFSSCQIWCPSFLIIMI